MSTGQGVATIDFGAYPGSNEAQIAVTGQASISATSKVEAYVMGDDTTSDHTASDHRYVSLFAKFTGGTPTAGTGSRFTVERVKRFKALLHFVGSGRTNQFN